MFEELLISVLFIILCIISNLYSKKEEEKEKNKRRQEYEELHTLSGRFNYHRSQEISTYKIDEYKIGDWEKIVKKYSSNIDNLKFLDQQAEFMKVFETDKLKAKEDGLKIGIDKGKAISSDNKAIEIAKKMLSTDASIDYIAKMTGLSKEKINSLK